MITPLALSSCWPAFLLDAVHKDDTRSDERQEVGAVEPAPAGPRQCVTNSLGV